MERGGQARGRVRTRIQNSEYRIQNGAQPAGANVAPTACMGSKTGNMTRREQRERRLAAREQCIEQRAKRSLEPISGVERELPRRGLEVGRGGKRRVGRRASHTIGGQGVGKWTGFSHIETALIRLFPHKSTQVVDFPHLAHVRLFWEEGFHRRGAETQRRRGKRRWEPRWGG